MEWHARYSSKNVHVFLKDLVEGVDAGFGILICFCPMKY
jgi:hypothetical protein